jgi:hypothetical protein
LTGIKVVELSTICNYLVEVEGQLADHWPGLLGRQIGADCKGFTDWGNVSGVPIGQTAPLFFLESYPQPYPQGEPCPVDNRLAPQPRPPVLKIQRGGLYTPQQNIFAKVRSPLTCGYTICAVTHTAKNAK